MPQKISVLGAGNAGFTIAWHLAHMGNDVLLFEHPDFAAVLEPIRSDDNQIRAHEKEGEEFTAVLHGTAKLKGATSDIREAVEFADIVMIIVPAFGQVPIFELALPHTRDGQIFMMLPGNFCSLAFVKLMKEKGVTRDLTFVETDSIPYACRRVRNNEIFVSGMKKYLTTGVFPGNRAEATLAILQPLFTLNLAKTGNVLEAAFSNMNMCLHPPPSLLNAGWIESTGGDFSFYRQGATKSVSNYCDALDRDRLAVAQALKLNVKSLPEILSGWYDLDVKRAYDFSHDSPYHAFFRGPDSLDNRYISEDMAYLLLPISRHLGQKVGVPTPAIDALTVVAEILTQKKVDPKREFSAILKDGEGVDQMQERLFTGKTD